MMYKKSFFFSYIPKYTPVNRLKRIPHLFFRLNKINNNIKRLIIIIICDKITGGKSYGKIKNNYTKGVAKMPYIAIKAYPKDEKIKKEIVEKINNIFLETWGCPQEAISISLEEIAPSDWDEKVNKTLIPQNKDYLMLLNGKKVK